MRRPYPTLLPHRDWLHQIQIGSCALSEQQALIHCPLAHRNWTMLQNYGMLSHAIQVLEACRKHGSVAVMPGHVHCIDCMMSEK